jgi:hypothetical protein
MQSYSFFVATGRAENENFNLFNRFALLNNIF